jgi:hypothetical protein
VLRRVAVSACVMSGSSVRAGLASRSSNRLGALLVVGLVVGCGVSKRQGEDQVAGNAGTGGSAGAPSGAGGKASSAGGAPATGGAPPLAENPFPCENPTPIFDGTSGFVECDNGYRYRESVGTCTIERRTEDVSAGLTDPECHYDADCADDPLAYCSSGYCYTGGFLHLRVPDRGGRVRLQRRMPAAQ